MDKEKEKKLKNSEETAVVENQPEKILSEQEEFSALEKMAKETETNIASEYDNDENLVKNLVAKVEEKKIPADLKKLELKAIGIKDEAVENVEEELETAAREKKFAHLPNYDFNSPEAKLVNLREAGPKIQERFNEKINPKMRGAISLIGSQVFNKGRMPYALIGSNCYIPHTEFSAKIPDDLDVVFGIQDLGINLDDIKETGEDKEGHAVTEVEKFEPGVYSDLVELEKQGLIKDLRVEELKKFGQEKNGCVKVKCQIKSGDGWVEMEAFGQNMAAEIAAGKNFNGIINLGAEEQNIETVDCDGVKVNIGSEKTAEELYLKNIINEFALYDLNGWKNRSYLNAKALQRIFNVTNLDSEGGDKAIDRIIKKIGRIIPPTEQSKTAQTVLGNLWENFKASAEMNGPGLVDYALEKNGNQIESAGNEEENKILKTERAVDIMTRETQTDMKSISRKYLDLKKEAADVLNSPEKNPEVTANLEKKIDKQIDEFFEIGHKYREYGRQANNGNPLDFCVYAAIPRLRNYFIKPVITNLEDLEKKLREKI